MKFSKNDYPNSPGVYLMKDSEDNVIYVGKASSLRIRLSSYFSGKQTRKTKSLVSQIFSIDFIITKDPSEALILESNMIKNYQPRFNMVLKDSKHFSYLAITDEKFPRLVVARKNSKGKFRVKASKFFGPFVEGSKRSISSRYLRKLFKIRVCKKIPKKECLQYHIGHCNAPCIGGISEDEYMQNILALESVLEGKSNARKLIAKLKERMDDASEKTDYESAASIRDQIDSLKIFFERQRVEKIRRLDEDYLWFEKVGESIFVHILKSIGGVISRSEQYCLEIKEQENPELSFALQYYIDIPDQVYTNLSDSGCSDLNSALKTKAFRIPGKEKKKILDIAASSIIHGKIDPAVMRLQQALSLQKKPVIIETFDISTLFGEESVASMVRFVNGKPDKSGYRKFKIKTVSGQDDYSMMNEAVSRRYSRLIKENSILPDLILIDGGIGQLNSALSALKALNLEIPIASIAKKEEEIFLPQKMAPVRLPKTDGGLMLVQRCRDEAHRFAINYHRLRHRKKTTEEN